MTTYVIELPDVVALALQETANCFGVEPEALIAEAIRALPEFQIAIARQISLVKSFT